MVVTNIIDIVLCSDSETTEETLQMNSEIVYNNEASTFETICAVGTIPTEPPAHLVKFKKPISNQTSSILPTPVYTQNHHTESKQARASQEPKHSDSPGSTDEQKLVSSINRRQCILESVVQKSIQEIDSTIGRLRYIKLQLDICLRDRQNLNHSGTKRHTSLGSKKQQLSHKYQKKQYQECKPYCKFSMFCMNRSLCFTRCIEAKVCKYFPCCYKKNECEHIHGHVCQIIKAFVKVTESTTPYSASFIRDILRYTKNVQLRRTIIDWISELSKS